MKTTGPTPWQARWAHLADRLEVALENKVYRSVLCAATVVLVLIYVHFATRLAQPTKWVSSPLISIQESHAPTFLEIDEINRSIVRFHRWASVLQIQPAPQIIGLDEFFGGRETGSRNSRRIEARVVRLWLEEIRSRSEAEGGIFDLAPDAVADAMVSLLDESKPTSSAKSQSPEAGWFTEVRSVRDTCINDEDLQAKSLWKSLCKKIVAETDASSPQKRGDFDRPNPLSLKSWLSSQIVAEARALGTADRISYLRRLARETSSPELLALERLESWPASAVDFGSNVRRLVTVLSPNRLESIDFSPRLKSKTISLVEKNSSETRNLSDPILAELRSGKIKLNLLVLKSCEAPTVAEVLAVNVRAEETAWVKSCDPVIYLSKVSSAAPAGTKSLDLASVSTVREMAERNREISFVQIGIPETELALKRGWLNRTTRVTEPAMYSTGLLRAQRIDRDKKWNTVRYRAPVEAIKLARQ